MMPCVRPAAPQILTDGRDEWTAAYTGRRRSDPGATFSWPTVENKPLNQHILPLLMAMTEQHCAYCDGYPLTATGYATIDHFRPKSRFPADALTWDNLFPACLLCQKRCGGGVDWCEALLKPDMAGYDFARYFRFVAATGEIESNPEASEEDQHCADETIRIFALNIGERPAIRRNYIRRYRDADDEIRAYRFAFL